MAITTSIVIQFGSEAASDASLSVEVDDRENGLNAGRTSFVAGDSMYLLLYRYNVQNVTAEVTAGTITKMGSGSRVLTEDVNFSGDNAGTLRYPPQTINNVEWIGASLGSITSAGGVKVRSAQAGIGIARVTYTTQFTPYRLNAPSQINGRTNFPIMILFKGDDV